MSAKAPFLISDDRIYDVVEYRARHEWEWDHEIVLDYDVVQRLHQGAFDPKKREKITGVSGSPFSFLVVMPVDDVLQEVAKLPPPEKWLVQIARYHIQCWLENNGLSAHHHKHYRPIILRPFS